MIFDGRGAKVV